MKFKIDGKVKAVVGVLMAIYAGIHAYSVERSSQAMEDELEELKSEVAKLKGKES